MNKTKQETKNLNDNISIYDKFKLIETANKSSILQGPKKDNIFYPAATNQQQQIDCSNLVNKLADSHAASIFNSLNTKLNNSTSSLSNKVNNNNNFSAIAFSKPIAQSLNFNTLLKNEIENIAPKRNNQNQSISISNRLIELPSGSSKSSTFNLSQSLSDNSTVSNRSINFYNQMNRSVKTGLNEYEKKNYRASLKTFYDLNLKSAQTNTLVNSHNYKNITKSKDDSKARANTVKLFSTNEFKTNLPPINKYRLFNNFDKKLGVNRTAVEVGRGPLIVSGEKSNKSKTSSSTPNTVSRISNNRPLVTSLNRNKRAQSSAGRIAKKSIDTTTSRLEINNSNDSNSDELKFQIDKICKISFNSKSKNGQNWSDNDSIYFNDDYFFNNKHTKNIILKNSNINKCEENYILFDSDNKSEFNYASLDEDETNDLYNDNNIGYLTLLNSFHPCLFLKSSNSF